MKFNLVYFKVVFRNVKHSFSCMQCHIRQHLLSNHFGKIQNTPEIKPYKTLPVKPD